MTILRTRRAEAGISRRLHQYRPEVRPYPPEKNRRTDIKETDRGPENGKM